MIETLNPSGIEELLSSQVIGRIGCHANCKTFVVPVSYAYDGNCIYVHSYEGLKIAMMRKNPAVCFEVDDTVNTANWRSVIAWGVFEELQKPEDRKKAVQILNDRQIRVPSSLTMHLGATWPFQENDVNEADGILFRICLTEKTGRFEKNTETPVFPL